MHSAFKDRIRDVLKRFDIGVTNSSFLEKLEQDSRASNVIGLLLEIPHERNDQLLRVARDSRSQLGQDMFALFQTGFKQNGYFVEFGATNGIDLSNTYLLETKFGWKGIVAEPARCWHEALKKNRHCQIETNCVWSHSNLTLDFAETDWWEFSGVNPSKRSRRKSYPVQTISLQDLLEKYNAPQEIDFLSLDTEGSEYEILASFDLDKYRFKAITCEHNFTPQREKIFERLTSYGYARVFEKISDCDDWYVDVRRS